MVPTAPRQFLRGAKPSPRHKLLASAPFQFRAAPLQFALVPTKLSMWGNDQYGDCVTAEEAFAKACYTPEIYIGTDVVTDWAERHGVLNGATLTEVLDAFARGDGFQVGTQRYNDGPYNGVDYTDQSLLQSAISTGPVKIAIDADALPQGAGNQQGWYATGLGRFPNTDHCVALCGYGPAEWLYAQLRVPLPAALLPTKIGYLLFTWNTIGFVDHNWLLGTCVEAWARNPTTLGVPPLTPPVPPPPPVPYIAPFDCYDASGAQVGRVEGYAKQFDAHVAAQALADSGHGVITVKDSSPTPQVVETVSPTPPVPPTPLRVTVQFPETQCVRDGFGQFHVPAMTLTGVAQTVPEGVEASKGGWWMKILQYGFGFALYVAPALPQLLSGAYTSQQIEVWILAALAAYNAAPRQPLPPLPA